MWTQIRKDIARIKTQLTDSNAARAEKGAV